MELPFYHVDAFANESFKGNPAAVFVLENWLPEKLMQAIAGEFNLSETVFAVPQGNTYGIRWFTPETEVALCGHATLATSHVMQSHLGYEGSTIHFESKSGPLTVKFVEGTHTLDFPTNTPSPVAAPEQLSDILGTAFTECLSVANKLIVVLSDDSTLAQLTPDFNRLAALPYRAVCVTAVSHLPDIDFVCRFFAPAIGINEDPVTGSAYTMLAPYFANRLGKNEMSAKQLSKRSGELSLQLNGERVLISGTAHTVMQGQYYLDNK